MLSTKQAFISAYLKGEEARLVSSGHLEGILRSATVQEILAAINGTDVGSYLEGTSLGDYNDIESALWIYLGDRLQRVMWFRFIPTDVRDTVKAYLVKYDVFNIKASLRHIANGKEVKLVPLGTVFSNGMLEKLLQAEDLSSISTILKDCKLGDYAQILGKNEKQISSGEQGRLIVESKLDNQYYTDLLKVTQKSSDKKLFKKVLGMDIDLANLQIVFRSIAGDVAAGVSDYIIYGGHSLSGDFVKELLSLKLTDIPVRLSTSLYRTMAQEILTSYERTKSLAIIDETMEKYRYNLFRDALAPKTMSPSVVLWYLILKEIEIRNIRLAFKAVLDKIPVNEVKGYMVLAS